MNLSSSINNVHKKKYFLCYSRFFALLSHLHLLPLPWFEWKPSNIYYGFFISRYYYHIPIITPDQKNLIFESNQFQFSLT